MLNTNNVAIATASDIVFGWIAPRRCARVRRFLRRLTMATQNRSLQRAVRYALLAGAAGAAATALPTQAADQTIQEVVVTGSRIAQPNLETTSPVTQVTAEDVITRA
jgi:outer membrane receptor protein involved in Fe transport